MASGTCVAWCRWWTAVYIPGNDVPDLFQEVSESRVLIRSQLETVAVALTGTLQCAYCEDSHVLFRNVSSRFGTIEHEQQLAGFGIASCGRRISQLPAAREALEAVVGKHGVADAGGIVAMFASLSRVVDLTGHKSTVVKIVAGASGVVVVLRRNALLIIAAAIAIGVFWFNS
jgi:hypothetical protein